MNDSTTIGFISGTGPQGRGLAMRLALAGLRVRVGSRNAERAQGAADELNRLMEAFAGAEAFAPIGGGDNHQVVAGSDLVLLTVPFEHAAATLEAYRNDFRDDAVFVDVTVPLVFGKGDPQVEIPPEGSGSRHLRAILPARIPFTGAFKTLPAHVLEELETPLDCDTFVFGDDKGAKQRLMEVVAAVPGLRPVDVGGISAAATLEGMTALAIRINRRMKSKSARYRVVGTG